MLIAFWRRAADAMTGRRLPPPSEAPAILADLAHQVT
jgi:hypothetical protein